MNEEKEKTLFPEFVFWSIFTPLKVHTTTTTTTTTKSLQLCPTLCDPIDGRAF